MVKTIDVLVRSGRFQNRSDAIKSMIAEYEEREKTRNFFEMLKKESEEARKHPEKLVPIEDLL